MKTVEEQASAVVKILAQQNSVNEVDVVDVILSAYKRGREDALDEAVKAVEVAKCGSDTPWDCGCEPGINAIRALKIDANNCSESIFNSTNGGSYKTSIQGQGGHCDLPLTHTGECKSIGNKGEK